MVSSLSQWCPASSLACPLLRKATAGASKLQWTDALEKEYQDVRRMMKSNLRLSPYDLTRFLNLVIDGSAIHGVGYVLFQWTDEADPSAGATIVSANSSLLPPHIGFSPVDGEVAALQFATKCCYYYLLPAPKLRLYSDCKGLVQMLEKDLIKITNPKHF